MKRLAVIPNDPIGAYLSAGYNEKWLREYFNPGKFFEEVYVLSPQEPDNPDLLGMKSIQTKADELRKRLKELKIDVVRAYGGAFACEVACRNKVSGIPVVVSVHDTNPKELVDWIGKADVVLCMTRAVKELVMKRFHNDACAWILPNRVHFDYMRPYSKAEIGEELDKKYPYRYKIVHVGRKVRQKNLDNLIKSLKHLGKDYCLLAVGKGDDAEYRKIAKEAGVIDQCFFIESIPNEELARYFSWADCMCMPSRWEGFGIVIIEALAAEAVFVGSDIPEIEETIEHLQNGLLIKDFENPQAIAEMVKLACTDGQVREILKRNARKSVERFEQSKVDELEVEYYKKVLKMNAEGAFKMSLKEKIASTSIGSALKNAVPVSLRKKILSVVKR